MIALTSHSQATNDVDWATPWKYIVCELILEII